MISSNQRKMTTFVEGIGRVPTGPRSNSRSARSPTDYSRTRQPRYPDYYRPYEYQSRRNRSEDHLRSRQVESSIRASSASTSAQVAPKEEEIEESVHSFPSVQAPEAIKTSTPTIKREDSVEPGEIEEDSFPEDFTTLFQRHLMDRTRSTRSDTTGSRRQDTSEGSMTRSDVVNRDRDTQRSRTRSPRRSRESRFSQRRDSRDGSMFFPDRQSSTDSVNEPRTSSAVTTQDTSMPPSAPTETEEDEDPRCRCPIGYFCSVRSSNHLDCRPLVRDTRSWTERRDQEAFARHRAAASQGVRFTTQQDLMKILAYMNSFMVINHTVSQAAVQNMLSWIMDMEDVTIRAGIEQTVTTQHIVPALQNFLSPANASARRAKNLPDMTEEELTVLERKWGRGDFSGNIKRGLTAIKLYDVNGTPYYTHYQVDKTWAHYQSGLYFGAGNLVNGQVWESRPELQRDGVHAPTIAGISGTSKHGARSILLGKFDEKKNIGYADIDMGETIEYMGTALPDQQGLGPTNDKDPHMVIPGAWNPMALGQPTAATRALFKSMETKEPVRVIRSFEMCDIVSNKPCKGYRYDGLYVVKKATAMKEARQIWSFRLERVAEQLPHQGPLRGFPPNVAKPSSTGSRMGHFHK